LGAIKGIKGVRTGSGHPTEGHTPSCGGLDAKDERLTGEKHLQQWMCCNFARILCKSILCTVFIQFYVTVEYSYRNLTSLYIQYECIGKNGILLI
jgi:hypothetical protein